MAQMDPAAHADTIEYYRLTLEARKTDPHAKEAARVDEDILEMVRQTPDLLGMNKQFMEGGLSFRLGRALAVDGALYQAEIYSGLGQVELAEHWKERAEALARVEDYAGIDKIAEEWGLVESQLRETITRTMSMVDEALNSLLDIGAAEPGSKLSDGERVKLEAGLKEMRERHPDKRFPELLRLPYIRDRLPWSDDKLALFDELFEKVNQGEFKGVF